LDEIQECPEAIMSLRYFKEERSDIHIIGAGSLLEFTLKNEDFRMPVGRVESKFMHPMSFDEFLWATGREHLQNYFSQVTLNNPPNEVAHTKGLKALREYFALGGMPDVLSAFVDTHEYLPSQHMQLDLLRSYRDDFGKYAKHTDIEVLDQVYSRLPGIACKWFKYSKIDGDTRAEKIKTAVQNLRDAGLVNQVFATNANGIPLAASMNHKKFKLLFIDIGLMQRAMETDIKTILRKDLMLINEGQLSEQFVGQELLSYTDPNEKRALYFWNREKTGSSAEVDYVTVSQSQIIPIEVKSKAAGHLKSLQIFLKERNLPLGLCVSTNRLKLVGNILYLPMYMISSLHRFIGDEKV
ncbi:MAG: ATP-binding protein, partial [Chlamydiia bacterium]|nr:ATP-binding protein [Chlamydiia bacterium]